MKGTNTEGSADYLFAIPFYKNASYLSETLNSLKRQTDTRWKAIVFDDSLDSIQTEAARKATEGLSDPRIRYHRNEKNLGMAINWNQGLQWACDHKEEFDLVSILHADDRLLPDYVSSMREASKLEKQASAFFCRTQIIDADGNLSFSVADTYKKFLLPTTRDQMIRLQSTEGVASLVSGNYIFCPTLTFRVSAINEVRFKAQYRMVLDFDFILRLLLSGHEIVGLYQKPLFEYRRHSQNATHEMTQSLERFKEEVGLYDELAKELQVRGELQLAQKTREKTVIKLNLGFQMVKALLKLEFVSFQRFYQFWLSI